MGEACRTQNCYPGGKPPEGSLLGIKQTFSPLGFALTLHRPLCQSPSQQEQVPPFIPSTCDSSLSTLPSEIPIVHNGFYLLAPFLLRRGAPGQSGEDKGVLGEVTGHGGLSFGDPAPLMSFSAELLASVVSLPSDVNGRISLYNIYIYILYIFLCF